jgi:uncharacterized protein (DUF58 family)
MSDTGHGVALRGRAEALSSALPPLLLAATALADTVRMGAHGRRRTGSGTEFWQYRPAQVGDASRMIDWRRSARADAQVVREREWQLAQSAWLWVDPAASLHFSAVASRSEKAERAKVLALAMGLLLTRSGERVGLLGGDALPARAGRAQVEALSLALASNTDAPLDTGAIPPHAEAILISDFLADPAHVEAQVAALASRGVRGALLQVLDPVEEDFPFQGRTLFENIGGSLKFESADANDLRPRYLARLMERRERMQACAHAAGWQFGTHHTGDSAQAALLWLAGALEAAK